MQGSENWFDDGSGALPDEARSIVDICVERIAAQAWRQRRDTIEATIAAGHGSVAKYMTGSIVAAVIERLNTPEITENAQAELFAMSACLDHQIAACDWFIEAASDPVLAVSAAPVTNRASIH